MPAFVVFYGVIVARKAQGASSTCAFDSGSFSATLSMGKLIDQDYLWLQEKPQRPSRRSNRFLPVAVVALAALGGSWYYLAAAGHNSHEDAAATVPPADDSVDARTGVHTSELLPHRTLPGTARAFPAVASASQARLTPVNRIIGSDPASALDEDLDALAADDSAGDTPSDTPLPPGWRAVTIRSGDTLSIAFGRYGLSYMDSLKLAHMDKYGRYFTSRLKGGDRLTVKADAQGRVEAVNYPIDVLHTLEVKRQGDRFSGDMTTPDVEHHRAYASGVITTSFYADALAAGLDDRQILTLNRIFSWDIDFGQDIRPGDRFVAVYDELYHDGKKIGNGELLAAAFINKGHEYRALRYSDSDGDTGYYTPSGQPMKKAFVRAPVDYTRISSPFNSARMHPILHRLRRHEGTDYAAPEGTPIHATGDGRITFQGRRGGYGNMVIIRHSADVTMRFGHMSRFAKNLHTGSRVKQGQVIGYVGMTGLATGPHVHYEFRVDGVPHDPQTARLPGVPPLSGKQLASFRAQTSTLVASLDDMSQTHLAQAANHRAAQPD